MVQSNTYIYVYRYLWQEKHSENICVKVLSGVPAEHDKFITSIKSADNIVKCTRVYMAQYDPNKLEEYETIKKLEVENE